MTLQGRHEDQARHQTQPSQDARRERRDASERAGDVPAPPSEAALWEQDSFVVEWQLPP